MIRGNVRYKLLKDHLGSILAVVHATNGNIIQQLSYDEFGKVLTDTNPGFQPFGFAGGLYDNDTQLVRFGAREYNATIARWMTKDPILFNGGDSNLYGYVLQDSVNLVDVNGKNPLAAVAILAGVGGFAGGIGTLINGGDADQIKNAIIGGAIGGAASSLGALAAAAGGASFAISVALAALTDITIQLAYAPGGVDDIKNVGKGLNEILKPTSKVNNFCD